MVYVDVFFGGGGDGLEVKIIKNIIYNALSPFAPCLFPKGNRRCGLGSVSIHHPGQ